MRPGQTIMLVEDDEVDQMTVKRALRDLEIKNKLIVASDGEEALDLLAEGALPALLLLDINMPRMSGIELLTRLKSSARFRRLPVVMLTTSKDDHDKTSSFENCVAGYMVKPVDYEEFVELMRTLFRYWSLSEPAA